MKKVEDVDPDKVSIDLLRQAEELIERCNRHDKKKNLLLSKPAKSHHRNMIKKDFGIVRGFVQETNIVPRSSELFELSQQEFGILGQKIHSRRNKASFKSFDVFKSDARKIALVETVFEDENKLGKFFFACSCDDSRFPSGCKGKACLHVVVAMIEAGMIKTRAKDRKISNYHHRKGAAKKNTKQN